jgi:hypothetical protein
VVEITTRGTVAMRASAESTMSIAWPDWSLALPTRRHR